MIRTLALSCLLLCIAAPVHAGRGARVSSKTKVTNKQLVAKTSARRTSPAKRTVNHKGLAGVFGRIATKSGKRALHAEGEAFHATVKGADGKTRSAVVRLSRGGATKNAKKSDILGVAVQVNHGGGRTQDFLLVTSLGTKGVAARVPMLRGSFGGRNVSSLLSFKQGKIKGPITAKLPPGIRTQMDTKAPGVTKGKQSFKLELQNASTISKLLGRPARANLGNVTVDFSSPLSAKEHASLKMTPFNQAGGVKPAGVINKIRKNVYRASQDGRTK